MHDGMRCDLIQGQGHKPLKVRNSAIFRGYFLPIYNGGFHVLCTVGVLCSIKLLCCD